jgi:predicted AAA+ superfamily ATPase
MGAAPIFAAATHAWECYFVTSDFAIQCCARLTPENRQRELRGLLQAAKLPGSSNKRARELCVITLDQEDALTEEGHAVHVIPAWKWLD